MEWSGLLCYNGYHNDVGAELESCSVIGTILVKDIECHLIDESVIEV